MTENFWNEKIQQQIIQIAAKHHAETVYLFGSFLRPDFEPQTSDIDVMIVMPSNPEPELDLMNLKKELEPFLNHQIEFSILLHDEFQNLSTKDNSEALFIRLRTKNKLLYGQDQFKDKEITIKPENVLRRANVINQKVRHHYFNSQKDQLFSEVANKWLKILVLDVLLLHGEVELEFEKGIKRLEMIEPELKIKGLLEKPANIEKMFLASEKIKQCIEKYAQTGSKRNA